jgi:hypothetical protein
MANNTLTNLAPVLFSALAKVSRELVGMIPAVGRDSSAEKAAVNQTVRIPVAPTVSTDDIEAGVTAPDDGGQVIGYTDMTVTKSKYASLRWTGEEEKSVSQSIQNIKEQQFAQAMRALVNEVEADLAALYPLAPNFYGTAGTTPFASTLGDTAQARKILADNGAPSTDMQLVINTTAGAALRTLAQLTKANEAGGDSLLRQGVLLDLHGFAIRESAQIKTHTKGTGTSYDINDADNLAIGDTTIAVDTGSGTILAGDIVKFGTADPLYMVKTALSGGSFVLHKPLTAAVLDGADVTIGANYAANLAFDRSAIQLLTRVPAMPEGGDSADDVMVITDPISGLSFQVAVYRQYRQVRYEFGLAWGVKMLRPEHCCILLG